MEFLRHVESDLRDLATAARHCNSLGRVKDASEYGVMKLRELRSQYAREVREKRGNSYDSQTILPFRCQELLDPFVLACDSSSPASLISIALNGLNFLLTSSAVLPSSMCSLMSALTSVGLRPPPLPQHSNPLKHHNPSAPESPSMIQLKAMQTSILLLNSLSCEHMTQPLVASILNLSGQLMLPLAPAKHKSKKAASADASLPFSPASSKMVTSAATATFSQLISLIFDRVSEEICEAPSESGEQEPPSSAPLSPGVQAAVDTFTCLCDLAESTKAPPVPAPHHYRSNSADSAASQSTLISVKEAFDSIKFHPTVRCTCLEQLNMVLSSQTKLFSSKSSPFNDLLRFKVCPLVTTALLSEHHHGDGEDDDASSSPPNFSLLVKLMNISATLLLSYGGTSLGGGECHILITALLHFVSTAAHTFQGIGALSKPFCFGDNENKVWVQGIREEGVDSDSSSPSDDAGARGVAADVNDGVGGSKSTSSSSSAKGGGSQASAEMSQRAAAMWRATLALEILYRISSDEVLVSSLHTSFDSSRPNNTIIAAITQTLSDYVISVSAEEQIMSVVNCAYYHTGNVNPVGFGSNIKGGPSSVSAYDPKVFHLASQNDSSATSDVYPAHCGDGEAIYLGLRTCLSLIATIQSISNPGLISSTVNPLHLTLQHTFMYLSGSAAIMSDVLLAYESLVACVIDVGHDDDGLQTEVLTSLCKFSLPNFRDKFETSIGNFHAKSIAILFSIVHGHARVFSRKDWALILSTFEQLSFMPVASKKLSDDSYDIAIALNSALSLLAEFTCTMSANTIEKFIEALVEMKGLDSRDLVQQGGAAGSSVAPSQSGYEESHSTLGSRLMNIASRTIQNLQHGREPGYDDSKARLDAKRMFGEDLRERAFSRLSPNNRPPPNLQRKLSFAFVVLLDTAVVNKFRGDDTRKVRTCREERRFLFTLETCSASLSC